MAVVGPLATYPGINTSGSGSASGSDSGDFGPVVTSTSSPTPSGQFLGMSWWIWIIALIILAVGGGFMFMSK